MNKPKPSDHLENAPLGKKSAYIHEHSPQLLFAIPRKIKRDEIQIPDDLPFQGYDLWSAFELSWLNSKGKPVVAIAEFEIPCDSPFLIESKSFKLYLNSLNNTHFHSFDEVKETLKTHLSKAAGANVSVQIDELRKSLPQIGQLEGTYLDHLDIECSDYTPRPDFLTASGDWVEETLCSDLLKSNCLVTGQPDWGSLQIRYSGKKIQHEGLLKYIVSLRNHHEFHEQCVERIFMNILKNCQPEKLSVYARYTRRGGLDINPYRSNYKGSEANVNRARLIRQ